MGISRQEIRKKEQAIIDFSELGNAIDKPVRSYSSGMKSRLGFAVSINANPDILIIDEALSVGDSAFQQKCKAAITKLIEDSGVTLLLVTHSAYAAQEFCERGILLIDGQLMADTDIHSAIRTYQSIYNYDVLLAQRDRLEKAGDSSEIKIEVTDGVDESISLELYRRLYLKLHVKGYSVEEIHSIFKILTFREITPLLCFGMVNPIDKYIHDVMNNREANHDGSFFLDGEYLDYDYVTDTYVGNLLNLNFNYRIPEKFFVGKVRLDDRYSVDQINLSPSTRDAFIALCETAAKDGIVLKAREGYINLDYQRKQYEKSVRDKGSDWAKKYAIKPRHTEHNLGEIVGVAAAEEDGLFENSRAFAWMLENAPSLGWVMRYPYGTSKITGRVYAPQKWRFTGKRIALDIQAQQLTFDEYWELYLKPLYF